MIFIIYLMSLLNYFARFGRPILIYFIFASASLQALF